jgi:hypothetical protein
LSIPDEAIVRMIKSRRAVWRAIGPI